MILQLQQIAQELPTDKFAPARKRIEEKYLEIQNRLIDDFAKSQRTATAADDDLSRMKHLAAILSQFKRYNSCVDEFIEGQIQRNHAGGGGGRKKRREIRIVSFRPPSSPPSFNCPSSHQPLAFLISRSPRCHTRTEARERVRQRRYVRFRWRRCRRRERRR